MATKKDTPDVLEDTSLAQPKIRKKKLRIIALIALLALGLAGGAAYWLKAGKAAKKATTSAATKPHKPPIFEKLEIFTANLVLDATDYSLVQVELTLSLATDKVPPAVKAYMPEIRDGVLSILSAKTPSALLSKEGKIKTAKEIQARINKILHLTRETGVTDVYYVSFVMQ